MIPSAAQRDGQAQKLSELLSLPIPLAAQPRELSRSRVPGAADVLVVSRTPFASSAAERFDDFTGAVFELRHAAGVTSQVDPTDVLTIDGPTPGSLVSEDLLGHSEFALAVAEVDAWDRIASMALAMKREAVARAHDHAAEHLVAPDTTDEAEERHATPGAVRLHRNCRGELIDVGDRYLGMHELAASAIAPMLALSKGRGMYEVTVATDIAAVTPNLHERALRGDYGDVHVHAFLDALNHLPAHVVADADAAIAATPGRVSLRELRRRISNFLTRRQLPARGAAAAQNDGHASRRVTLGPTDMWGMANLNAYLAAPEAAGIYQLLSDLAATAPSDDTRHVDQRRADAFVVCFTGPAAFNPALATQLGYEPATVSDPRFPAVAVSPEQQRDALGVWETMRMLGATLGVTFSPGLKTQINVHVPVTTFTDVVALQGLGPPGQTREGDSVSSFGKIDPRSHPGDGIPGWFTPYVEGFGSVSNSYFESIMEHAVCRRILTDPATGAPLDIGKVVHDPPTAMRRRVLLRDGVCRFPGCATPVHQPTGSPSHSIDLDHVNEHHPDGSGGATADANLQVLCVHHHRVKHQTPWTPVLHEDGRITWRNDLLRLVITTYPDSDVRDGN